MIVLRAESKQAKKISEFIQGVIENIISDKFTVDQLDAWIYANREIEIEKLFGEFENNEVYILKIDDKIAGTFTLNKNKISRLFIRSDLQGKGYGVQLLSYAEDIIRKNGYKTAVLQSVPSTYLFFVKNEYIPKEKTIQKYNGFDFPEQKMVKNL